MKMLMYFGVLVCLIGQAPQKNNDVIVKNNDVKNDNVIYHVTHYVICRTLLLLDLCLGVVYISSKKNSDLHKSTGNAS